MLNNMLTKFNLLSDTQAEIVTGASTEEITEAVTEAVTEVTTQAGAATEAVTEGITEAVTEAVTAISSGSFHPMAFVDNLKYMAAGMVGIFIVIGAIVLTILLLSKLTDRKKNDGES